MDGREEGRKRGRHGWVRGSKKSVAGVTMKYTMKRWRRAVYRDKRTAVAVHGVYGEQRKGFEPSRRKAVSLFLLEVYMNYRLYFGRLKNK